jgi:hypothetical protein
LRHHAKGPSCDQQGGPFVVALPTVVALRPADKISAFASKARSRT